MKSKNHLFKKFKLVFYVVICLIIVFSLAFYTRSLIQKLDMIKKYSVVAPREFLSSEEDLITKVYFNSVLGEDTILNPVVDTIHNAKNSIEIAMFSFDSLKIKKELYDAALRGVKVTLVLDTSREQKHDMIFSDLPSSIKRINLGKFDDKISSNGYSMHHKLLIADRGLDTEKVITGSMNYTSKGEKYEQGFLLVTSDKMLAKVYKNEMDLMQKGISGKKKLEEKDYNPWTAHIQYPNSYVDVWFSPGFDKNSVKHQIIEKISKAQKSINIIMWQFTDKGIADALISKAKEGIPVRIISENLVSNDSSSKLPYIKDIASKENINNIEVILDTKSDNEIDFSKLPAGFSPFIHHHFMIIDEETAILGTNNWSTWGFYNNDEDTLVTNNKDIVSEFQKTFDLFYKNLK